jgi:glycosyltransferase involved in cell wall biosynthesis
MKRVSAIVPTRDRSRQLREALTSIRALEGPDLEIELIVVDNGSRDDTEAVAAELGARFVRVSQRGAAASRNEGMRLATAPYIAFLDDDDLWLSGHIRPHLQMLEEHTEYDAVVGQIVLTDCDLGPQGAPYPTTLPADGNVFASFLHWIPQVGATVARTSVRDTVGNFDPEYEGDEDWDWHLRLALRHQVGFVASPSMLFRQRALGATADQHWIRLRNMRRVFLNNVRRAGSKGPGWSSAVRLFLHQNGQFCAYFEQHAQALAKSGRFQASRRAYRRAILSSPAHAIAHLANPAQFQVGRSILAHWLGELITSPARSLNRAHPRSSE